jgi:hypothetical protein
MTHGGRGGMAVRRVFVVLVTVPMLLIGLTVTSASGQGSMPVKRIPARHYSAARPAVVRGSAPGHGGKQATLSRFAVAARRSTIGSIARAPFAHDLMTSSAEMQKKKAETGAFTSNKPRLMVTTQASTNAPAANPGFPGVGFTGFIPPDVAGAVGPFQVVQPVNGRISIFNKNGSFVSTATTGAFFAGLGTPATDFTFDPRAIWDEYINRFVILETTRNDAAPRSNLLVAVSKTNDATAGWNLFAFNARLNGGSDTNNWCDYPQLGYDAQAFYFTCNMFSTGGGSSFQYSKIRIMTTGQFLGGSCCFWWDKWDLREGFLNLFSVFSIAPVRAHGAIPSDGGFLVAAEGQGADGNNLHIYRVPNPQNCCVPGNQTDPGLNQHDQGVGDYNTPPSASQPSGVQALDTGDTRLLSANSNWPFLFVSQNLADGSNSTVDFTEVNFGAFPTVTTVNDWQIGAGGMNRFYGGGDITIGNIASLVYSASNGSTFAGTRWIQIPSPNTCTTCFNGEFVLRSGTATYRQVDTLGRNRWGDYMTGARDPNGVGVWIFGEFVSSQDIWGTEIGLTQQTLDTSPPTTTAALNPGPNGAGWNNSNVTVQLSASDNGIAGVRSITYSASGANPIGTTTVNGSSANPLITADGTTTVFYSAKDNWGNIEAVKSITVHKDATPPIMTSAPKLRFTKGGTMGAGGVAPITVSWNATDALSGINHYGVWQKTDSGLFVQIGTPTGKSMKVNLAPGHSYQFAVDAFDNAGNFSPFLFSTTSTVRVFQQNSSFITYSNGWTTGTVGSGQVKFATAAGKTARLNVNGSQFAWVSTKGSNRGSAAVSLDGGSTTTVNTHAAVLKAAVLVYTKVTTSGSHSLQVKVLGTAGHPRIDVDAFLVIQT